MVDHAGGGWREYEEVAARRRSQVLHSSYAYAEATVLADQALAADACGSARPAPLAPERHDDRAQDARSLYFSLELRKLL